MSFLALALSVGSIGLSTVEDLAGSRWHPSAVYAHPISAEERIFIEFKPDGKVTGSGGCNRFSGSYAVDGDKISIGPLAATKMFCLDPPMSNEALLFGALARATRFARDGIELTLSDDDGTPLAQLAQTDAD